MLYANINSLKILKCETMQTFKSRIFKLTLIFIILFTISTVSASDVNDTFVFENQIDVVCDCEYLDEFYESQDWGSDEIDDFNLDEINYIDDINESYIEIYDPTSSHEDLSGNYEENIESALEGYENESCEDVNSDVTTTYIIPDFINLNDIFVFSTLDHEINLFESADFNRTMFKFIKFNNPHLYNHGIFIYTLNNILFNDLTEEIIICSDKTNSNYIYSIDNSIDSVISIVFNKASFFSLDFFNHHSIFNHLFSINLIN